MTDTCGAQKRHFLVIASIFFVKLEVKSSVETSMVQEFPLLYCRPLSIICFIYTSAYEPKNYHTK